jgi:hypothetical protein
MALIKDVLNYIATGLGDLTATLLPYAFIGMVGLYLLWLVIGYLRVSQVGIQAESATLPAVQLPRAPDGAVDAPRGVPYCPNDSLQYPRGARFCTQCEADLLVSCANCGATIRAADESCYRCGTHATLAAPASD